MFFCGGSNLRVVQINVTCGIGSTGKICTSISKLLTHNGIENYILYTEGTSNCREGIKYATKFDLKFQALLSRICGNYGFESKRLTRKLIGLLDKINPDVVHLHNIHGHNCNLEILFSYLKRKEIKIFWTFHDCWAFTGYCSHFSMCKCEQWIKGCTSCCQKNRVSWFFDRSKLIYDKKRKITEDSDLTIITPSMWLEKMVQKSFYSHFPIKVINNGIDLSIFEPTESDFKERYNIKNKYMVLGVAFDWGEKKGLDIFIKLAKDLPEKYQVVLVGVSSKLEKCLPHNIVTIRRTESQRELAGVYTSADIFVNPTREEVLGLVNIEALACGTPVITFNSGGSPECIDEHCGKVVRYNDYEGILESVKAFCETNIVNSEKCIERAKLFDQDIKFREYLQLYESVQ